jgi:predicted permease
MRSKLQDFLIIISIFSILSIAPVEEAKALDPRVKAVGTMAVYGTAGGLLLGVASYAFNSPGRSWAVGASVGLYLGIIFGGYVVGSHYYKNYKDQNPSYEEDYYPDTNSSPYEDGGGEEGDIVPADERWEPAYSRTLELRALTIGETPNLNPTIKKGSQERPSFFIPLYNYQF